MCLFNRSWSDYVTDGAELYKKQSIEVRYNLSVVFELNPQF